MDSNCDAGDHTTNLWISLASFLSLATLWAYSFLFKMDAMPDEIKERDQRTAIELLEFEKALKTESNTIIDAIGSKQECSSIAPTGSC